MKRWRSWLVLLICLITVVICVAFELNTYAWVSDATVVQGQVIEVTQRSSNRHGKSYAPKITYKIDSEFHELTPRLGSSRYAEYKVGEYVKVVISRDRERASIFSLLYLYGIPLFVALLVLLITCVTIIMDNGDMILHVLHPHLI